MQSSVELNLFIGPAVPVPAPRSVIDALRRVEVQIGSGDTPSGFQLTFSLSKRSPLQTLFLLTGGSSIPIVRVVIMVSMGAKAEVVMDGVMTHHEIQPGGAGGTSSLIVRGKDLTALMDFIEFNGLPYPAMPPALRVLTILAKYAAFGMVPMVIPSVVEDLPIPIERIPTQQGSDLTYVSQLASEVGYVFYIDPLPVPGTSRAYWGPEIKVGPPQPALNTDMDAFTNVESLSFRFDKETKEMPVVFIQDRVTRAPIPIPIPDITPMNPPLGLVPPLPPKLRYLNDTARLSPLGAVMQGMAYASQHSDAVTGEGSLNVSRYGRILKARQLVGVRGAGAAFDGLYYVKNVSHQIERGEYRQNFSLARNGLLSTLPRVHV
ncbi:hypothetical protein [Desulfopila aestuarii]|uniref:Phage protein D n=1 Tax=Desulfopila aestuarii DSM 18488 TaxID=1121416 RepID=A0A1M7XYM3_9BACT|nr:hypothetical protein [Desulfopila aestuarii]SHO44167.1 hypothetical protein SAMN02745220_00679 [Desulfopila aestuarii DSM 18488]